MKTNVTLYVAILFLFGIRNLGWSQYNPDRHNTSYNDGWISCEASASPNPERGQSHWIMYDLGDLYKLGQIHLWNTNVPGFENIGIKDYLIEYSTDGTIWRLWGESSASRSIASAYYLGEEGPDLGGLEARFLLITALSNYGGDCVGFSEIRIQTEGLATALNEVEELEGSVVALPSLFVDRTTIVLEDLETGNYIYTITDLGGQVIMRDQISIFQHNEKLELQTRNLVQGIYVFSISNGTKIKSIKIEKIDP